MIAGGWAAIAAAMFWFNSAGAKPSNRLWAAETLTVLTVTVAVMTVVVVDARRAWRGNAARLDGVHLTGLALGGVAWFLGGLCGTLFYFAILHSDYCGGTGGLVSFECVNRPGPVLDVLGVVVAVAAAPAFACLVAVGRYSRVAAWLSPIVIVGLYLLAACLWEPHAGFGVVGVDGTLGLGPAN